MQNTYVKTRVYASIIICILVTMQSLALDLSLLKNVPMHGHWEQLIVVQRRLNIGTPLGMSRKATFEDVLTVKVSTRLFLNLLSNLTGLVLNDFTVNVSQAKSQVLWEETSFKLLPPDFGTCIR